MVSLATVNCNVEFTFGRLKLDVPVYDESMVVLTSGVVAVCVRIMSIVVVTSGVSVVFVRIVSVVVFTFGVGVVFL